MKLEAFYKKYNSSIDGLSSIQVEHNQKLFGSNIVHTKKREPFILIWLRQFSGLFSIILSIAAIILFFLNDVIDFYVVLFIIVLNTTIEAVQKYKSDLIFESLAKVLPTYALAIRNGKKIKLNTRELVVGDVIILQAGDKVPVDGIIIQSENFKVDEALLTGESLPIPKESSEDYLIENIIDNPNMVFSGTYVTTGRATILTLQVGDATQIGIIAQKVSTIDTELPLYKDIRRLSIGIFFFVFFFIIFVLLIGLVQNQSGAEMFKVTVALLVSAIPESLPVMLTLILAYGFKRMSQKNVLVRKMHSLDVLGKINILALDKTGTVTHNQMKVEKIFTFNDEEYYVSGNGYDPQGSLVFQNQNVNISKESDTMSLVQMAALAADGSYYFDEVKKDWVLESGDPTEVSLLVLAEKTKNFKDELLTQYSLKESISFTNQNKYHSAIYEHDKKIFKIYTGAPEIIYAMCTHVQVNGVLKKINNTYDIVFQNKIKEFSQAGYRSLATCVEYSGKIICKGIFAINDSIRQDVAESVEAVYQKGIKIIMITGDHKDTALTVAKKIGIQASEHTILTGDDMSHLTDTQIKNIILQKNVFARVTPSQKLKILDLLKQLGQTVAMTGDGVNDTLALVKADIGISMGTISSDSAKEVSDIVLLDNKFGSVVYGVDEGKNIFSNIRKTILFLLSTNFAEMFVVVFAITLALPLPLSAVGILWINLVTDTFLVIGFALERNCRGCKQEQKIITRHEWTRTIYLGLIMTLIALIVFMTNQSNDLIYAQSLTLLVIIIMQWFNILNIRAGDQSIFTYDFKFNLVFILGWIISVSLTILAFLLEPLRNILQIHPISLADWVYVFVLALGIILFEEFRKKAQKMRLLFGK